MANPTTYFGWVMPTSSSLVTNLPADFNTFGQGVDTSLQDLLGGTTGQVLSKTSGTNMDFTWVTPTDQTPLTTKGDLFAFSTLDARLPAGANETRLVADSAQTLGLKYVADTTNYAIAAKADLLVGTAADTLAALTVGTNGQVLTADSTVSPTGLKWATPASGTTFAGAQASFSASGQTMTYTQNTNVILSFDYENYDTDGYHSTSTNKSRMTVPTGKGGYYMLAANGIFLGTVPGVSRIILYKNGTQYGEALSYGGRIAETEGNNNVSLLGSVVVAGAQGDYFEIAYQGDLSTGSKTAYGSFTIAYLGA